MPFAFLVPLLILNLPADPANLTGAGLIKLPAEIWLIILLLVLTKGAYFAITRLFVTIILALLLLLKLADIGTYTAFSRPFNPVLDGKLLVDGWIVLSGTVGQVQACLFLLASLLCFVLVVSLAFWSLRAFRDTRERRLFIIVSGLGLVVFGAIALFHPGNGLVEARAAPLIVDRVALVQRSLADRHAFEKLLANDPVGEIPADRRLNAFKGKDVIVIFIESYGESAVHDPRYAGLIGARLEAVEKELAAAGLAARSGWLVSPTSGGLSWLAHGTLLSGLWVDSQQRYDRLIVSERPSLNRLFRGAGWRSVAVMPAITMDWPEAGHFGYDAVYAANNLGYRGKPFNWVTMPDQYTLSAFQTLERGSPHRPVMAEIALISSHAPWTPIPKLLDWSAIGDGTIFNGQAMEGDPPDVVWRDQDRVRRQYAASIDYVLEVLGSYMVRHGRDTVFILLGDHQPAPIITGPDASRAVPVHIVSDDPTLLDRLDAEKWRPGMTPGRQQAPERMSEFRQELVRRFSDPH